MRWNDPQKNTAKIVSTLSTVHSLEMKNTGKVSRRNDSPILKPSVIIDYSKNMVFVDSISQIVHPYKTTRKGRKWFRKVFEMCCEIMALNATVIRTVATGRRKETFLDVLLQLIDEIISHHFHTELLETGRRQHAHDVLRLVERHFPDLIPPTANRQNPTRQCVVCSLVKRRRESRYFCSSCNVALCVVPCFRRYHTLSNPAHG